MLEHHYISSKEEIVNRKVRVYYHIEESGKAYLNELINEYNLWERKIRFILDFEGDIIDA